MSLCDGHRIVSQGSEKPSGKQIYFSAMACQTAPLGSYLLMQIVFMGWNVVMFPLNLRVIFRVQTMVNTH